MGALQLSTPAHLGLGLAGDSPGGTLEVPLVLRFILLLADFRHFLQIGQAVFDKEPVNSSPDTSPAVT